MAASSPGPLACPRCGSTAIRGDRAGFGAGKALGGGILFGPLGLLAGFAGSKRVVVACLNCGHEWPAAQQSRSRGIGCIQVIAALFLLGIAVRVCGPHGSTHDMSTTATTAPGFVAPKPPVAYVVPPEIMLTATAQRVPTGEIIIAGTTNLPDRTKLGAEVGGGQDYAILVSGGTFRSTGFTDRGRPLPPGPHKIHLLAHFNEAWQSADVLGAIGTGGSRLNGKFIKPEDPSLTDSPKLLDVTMTVQFPPVALDGVALDLVKKAVLTVDGQRSATDVDTNVALFMKAPGLRPAKGWLVSNEGSSKYLVSYSFVDWTLGEQLATWEADVASKSVRYVNEAAKNFSWTPTE